MHTHAHEEYAELKMKYTLTEGLCATKHLAQSLLFGVHTHTHAHNVTGNE